ncbi:MAG: hydrogenase 2 operon protein HybA [Rhodospirillaceae bacterium]|nr:hydrogenase 2 operon protein HybA [Rhodospirillaceae bacterium]
MTLNRRDFLKLAAAEGATGAAAVTAVTVCASGEVAAQDLRRDPRPMPDGAVGLLYDSTLCIGCRACQVACKRANGMPAEEPERYEAWNGGTWDTPTDLSGDTLTVIQVYQNGTMEVKDREVDGYAFVKRQCMHCTDASCVSVCPVSAMTKDAETGIVSHHPDRCIGCRYCVFACPFGVPRYEFDNPFGQIQKCQLCSNLPDQDIPACADVCPTGATLFGHVDVLEAEAQRRLAANPGDRYRFPRGTLMRADNGGAPVTDRAGHEAPVAHYRDEIYGEEILGSTQCRMLAGVPFDLLGLPEDVPTTSYASITEGIQHTLYRYMVAPMLLLGGLVVFAYRSSRRHRPEDWD